MSNQNVKAIRRSRRLRREPPEEPSSSDLKTMQRTKLSLSPIGAPLQEPLRVTTLRRDTMLGSFSLMELKKLPMNMHKLLLPTLACMAHIILLLFWRQRISSRPDLLPFGSRLWAVTPLSFTVVYILLTYLGTRMMRMRPPFDDGIREAMIVYHLFQTCFYCFLSISIYHETRAAGLNLWGNKPIDESESRFQVGILVWMHYFNLYTSLLDTLFVVVLKKGTQMTHLHVYRRVVSIWLWFLVLKFDCATGDVYLPACLMAVVEMANYAYHLLGLLGMKAHGNMKDIVTQMRMVVLAAQMILAVLSLLSGNAPPMLCLGQFITSGNFLLLYTDFHIKNRLASPTRRTKNASRSGERERVVFSFDSSGWFYVYHFGVAKYLQVHVLPKLKRGCAAYSGASGGALVGACLCAKISIDKVVAHILKCQPQCEYNPLQMLPSAEGALEIFLRPHKKANLLFSNKLSVLVTHVSITPPFFMGEAVNEYRDIDDAIKMLRASCHVPLLGGILPYKARGRFYYDGFFWPSFFVPWRQFHEQDRVIKTSAIGTLGAQISPSVILPMWWMIFPPSQHILKGMYQLGYQDAARFFRTQPELLKSMEVKTPWMHVPSTDSTSLGDDAIHDFEVEVHRAWLRLSALIGILWLFGLAVVAFYTE